MTYIYRISVAVAATLATFLLTWLSPGEPDLTTALTMAVAALLISGFILSIDRIFKNLDGEYFFCIVTGTFIGLIAGYYLDMALAALGFLFYSARPLLYLLPMVLFGFVGATFARYPGLRIFGGGSYKPDAVGESSREKILDTSVIIDGRILDIAETHFLEGPFIIPNFVLREIQLISDSPDAIKRNRGRRGLDMLNKLQQQGSVKVKISYIDYSDTREVDAKLVKLSRETGAKLVTNDFNLNKVAELQGVEVLNLNNLTNALKPVVLPGEEIIIDVIKEGKDENQGIGYLEDGTMVVVENGRSLLNKTVKVNVTSIIQTAAGKMIFTRATGEVESSEDPRRAIAAQQGSSGGRGGSRGGRGGSGGSASGSQSSSRRDSGAKGGSSGEGSGRSFRR